MQETTDVFYRIDLPAFGPEGAFLLPSTTRTYSYSPAKRRLRHLLRRNSPSPGSLREVGRTGDHALHGLRLVSSFDDAATVS